MAIFGHASVQGKSRFQLDAVALPSTDQLSRPVFAVADGEGNRASQIAEVAAATAVRIAEADNTLTTAVLAAADAAQGEQVDRHGHENTSLVVLLAPDAGDRSIRIAAAGNSARAYGLTDDGTLIRLTRPQPASRLLLPTYQGCDPAADSCGWGVHCTDHGPVLERHGVTIGTGTLTRVLLATSGVCAALTDDDMREPLRQDADPWTAARNLVARAQNAVFKTLTKTGNASALVIDL